MIEKAIFIIEEIADSIGRMYLNLYGIYASDGQLVADKTIDGILLKPRAMQRWYFIINLSFASDLSRQL